MSDILEQIVKDRRAAIARDGYSQGIRLAEQRSVPIIPFVTPPFVITEIKRRSPSKGSIGTIADPVAQAQTYLTGGSRHISVLTETDYFQGSLQDLIDVKNRFPHAAVLRKDFLLDKEDIEVSFRAGADAVLLIASILSTEQITELYSLTQELGMTALVEVHSRADIKKVANLHPELTGINCRDLTTFQTDLIHPLKIKNLIDWETRLVFESGIHSKEDSDFAFSAGFDAILTGESVVKNPALIARFLQSAQERKNHNFYAEIFSLMKRPLVKICGITRKEDAEMAVQSGADLIGVILAPSPREVSPEFVRTLKGLPVPIVAVTVNLHEDEELQRDIIDLHRGGVISAIQYHGEEPPEFCSGFPVPYFKALRLQTTTQLENREGYRSPRLLLDAFSEVSHGGTGKQIDDELLKKVPFPLWLAGGITPENAAQLIRRWNPELIDLSSGVESSPGIKDKEKIRALFRAVKQEQTDG